jgi:ADP-ribose pyrophosphatase YjhB (NUDIX family)
MEYFKFCPRCGAMLKWADIEARKRLCCTDCGWTNYLNPVPAAVCIVINERREVLQVKRAVEPELGKWSLPAGFIELYEEPEKAALRELEEETGLKGRIEKLIGVYVQSSETYGSVLTVGYMVANTGGILRPGDDVSDVKFSAIEDMTEIPFESHRKMLKEAGF